jgi:hypothetical protein
MKEKVSRCETERETVLPRLATGRVNYPQQKIQPEFVLFAVA